MSREMLAGWGCPQPGCGPHTLTLQGSQYPQGLLQDRLHCGALLGALLHCLAVNQDLVLGTRGQDLCQSRVHTAARSTL